VNTEDPKVVNAQVKQIFDNGALSKKSIDSLVGTSLSGFDAVDRNATARSRDSFDTVGWARSAPKVAFDAIPHVEKKYTSDFGIVVRPARPKPSFALAVVDVTPVAPSTTVPGIVATRVKVYLNRALGRIEACFLSQSAPVTMTVSFTVASDGRVAVTTPAGDPTVAGCVAREVGSLTLVQPSTTEPVGVVVVLVYRP
jgi:flavin-binding protein dodecin